MAKYKVTIEEHLSRTIEIEADSIDEAVDQVIDGYKIGDIVLDADDYNGVTLYQLSDENDNDLTDWSEI